MDGLLDRQQQLAEVLGVLAVQNSDPVLNRREEEDRNIGDPDDRRRCSYGGADRP
jgi:hypothetical protein